MSTDLVIVESPNEVASVERAREMLDQIDDISQIKDFADRMTAAEAYFKRAKETRDLAVAALEVRLWAERRAGWVLRETHGDDSADFVDVAREIGTSTQALRRWVRFSKADEKLFAATIEEAVERGELTITGVYRRLATKNLRRVERGIYLNYLDQYVIRWRDKGVSRQMTCETADLTKARAELLHVTEKREAETRVRQRSPREDVFEVYATLRRLLQILDEAVPQLKRPLRVEVERAYGGLHEAEDALGRALRVVER